MIRGRIYDPRRRDILGCFSPPIMIATMAVELAFAVWTAWRYRVSAASRLLVLTYVMLAIFQMAEFEVCAGPDVFHMVASRLGYVAITLLPPLGIHLAYVLAGVHNRLIIWPAYLGALTFSIVYLATGAITGDRCQGNYVIFHVGDQLSWAYGFYYYGWLLVGIILAWRLRRRLGRGRQHVLLWLMIGYLTFLVPTTIANFLARDTLAAIPSVMCGFAVLFAFILAIKIAPAARLKRRR